MDKKITFGKWEATFIIVNLICTKIFLNFPRFMAETAGTAGWLLAIYLSVLAFIAFFIIVKLYKPFEGKDLLDIGEYIGGNAGRIIVGTIVLGFSLYIVSVILREFSEDMKIIGLTVSPLSFVMFFFLIGIIVSSYIGVEGIARYSVIAVPIISVGFLLILVGASAYVDFTNILPLFGNGTNAILGKGFFKISVFSELLFLFILIPFIKTHKNFKAVGYLSIGISSVFLTLGAFVYTAVFSYPTSTESFLPIYQLSRLINYGRFFQRVESFFVIIWATAAFVYLSISFFIILYVFKKTFKLKYHRPLILPFAILTYTISLMPQGLQQAISLETKYFRNISWVITFVITILLLLVARVVWKRRKKREEFKKL